MKLTLPSSTIVAMALYGTRAAAFSTIARHQFGRNVVSTAARGAAASLLSAGALLNPTPVSAARTFTAGSSALRMADADSEAPFKTWTFDKSCDSMECNEVGSISISISDDASAVEDADLIVLGIQGPEKEEEKEGDEKKDDDEDVPEPVLVGKAKELDEQFGGALTDLLSQNYKEFKHGAKASSTTPTLTIVANGGKAKKVILLGLGNEGEDVDDNFMAKLGSTLASKCDATKNTKTCSLVLPSSLSIDDMPVADMSSGFYSALYSDNRYRTGDKIKKMAEKLESVSVVVEGELSDSASAAAAIESGKAIAKGVFMSKDIVNAPHNVLNSESLADVARKIAEESGGTITCTILGKEECEKRGMGAYLGVARGSETQPQFIHLTYKPKSGNVSKKVGIVGKGLLFDTGGYNIKTAMMELMKFDCGGSAAVLGAAKAVGELAPEGVEAHFIVAACENMINDRAVVPSDVLTASNGVTIEIINTDAEGRLTLADALVYADKEVGCESIIELSTLTGACMVSLGKKVCGVWTADDDLASDLSNVSKKTGEKSWRMPLEQEYNDQLKSKIADITNCGTRYGGAITAALFLENFVDKKKPFAHIDIAGPVWDDKDGATGFGAKMVTEWVSMQGKSE